MKKLLLLTLLALFLSESLLAQTMPQLSSEGNEHWYYIQFKREGAVLQDMGENTNLKTKIPQKNTAQLWKVTGTKDNYILTGKSGRKIVYSGGYFKTSTSSGSTFKILPTKNTTYAPALELQRTGGSGYMNQWGAPGPDRDLGEYGYGDSNNTLVFIKEADLELEAEITGKATVPDEKYSLWYREPATQGMTSALPIGNGQFGAMIVGGIRKDEIQFNDKTLWSGSPTIYGAYQDFGSLFIENKNISSVSNYRRELDIENAIARVTYTTDGVVYTREYFSSYPDSAVIIYLTASVPGKIDANLIMEGGHNEAIAYTNTSASFSGKLDLVSYYAKMSVKNDGGTISSSDAGIRVAGANSLMIVLRGNTNFSPASPTYTSPENRLKPNVDHVVSKAMGQPYKTLKQKHIDDYRSLFGRVQFALEGTTNTMPTDELIHAYNNEGYTDLFLEELYFHFGRYLMTGCARGLDSPSNLQGIWNYVNNPPWSSDLHSNINVQMNYWPAENTNLSELHYTFLNYIYNESMIHNQWKENAKKSGQTKGWTLFTENNIFGYHGPFMHNYVIANAWYCMHIWQHYRYTLDQEYLKNIAFPVMKTCCDFWLERLIQDRKVHDGTWVCPNEFSPEHGPSEDATAHSQQLVWDLFNNTLQAIDLLGENVVDAAFLSDLKNKFARLDKGLAIETSSGQLKEWKYSPNSVGEATHRHMSHLMGLYPGNQISPMIDKDIFNAAVKSLKDRGDQSTGWSMGWKINLWARALDGDHARIILNRALRLSKTTSINQYDGGIYQNLFDSHAPFQIDGNFGACAGIAEMLLQSHTGVLQILPALPTAWSKGNIQGLKGVNGFRVGIRWDHVKTEITVKSESGRDCEIQFDNIKNAVVKDENNKQVSFTVLHDNQIKFPTVAGKTYKLTCSERIRK